MKPLNILIVEDNEEQALGIARLLQIGLQRLGEGDNPVTIEIKIAGTLKKALELAQDANVTLLDLGLPDSDAFNTIESMHFFRPPVIVMTANTDPDIWATCLKRGADFVTMKCHVDINTLCQQVISSMIKDLAIKIAPEASHATQ